MLHNVLEGYALVDEYVARGVDLFDLQQLNLMLEINATVLCGRDPARRLEYAQHLAATEAHFFNNVEGGIKDLYNWYCAYRSESVWKRAAGVYVRILSKPQLFIEGNNRSGSLIVSYLLMRAGAASIRVDPGKRRGLFQPVFGHPQLRQAWRQGVVRIAQDQEKICSILRKIRRRSNEVLSQRQAFASLSGWPLMNWAPAFAQIENLRQPGRAGYPLRFAAVVRTSAHTDFVRYR